mmetsp:Transcript_32629/g.79022  ORF Transcript_32629/g.79022 Transcript_32629/m.79022 type:complete len:555 (-) Transcript_32629:56-1720(-)
MSIGTEESEVMLSGMPTFASSTRGLPPPNQIDNRPPKLTEAEISNALSLLGTLPLPVKDALAKAAKYPSYESILNEEEFIQNLYLNKNTSTEKMRRLYFDSFSKDLPSPTTTVDDGDLNAGRRGLEQLVQSLENGTRAMELFPRSVREVDEDLLPSEEDADVVFRLLERNFMATERPMKVEGGYIIRGENKRKSATELLDYLDGKVEKLHPEWTERYQLSLVEIYSDSTNELFEDAILISPNKWKPLAPRALGGITTAVALFSSFVYCIDAFGENEVVMQRLKDASEVAAAAGTTYDMYDLTWFNGLLIPLLVTLGAAQGLHEAAHLIVAWSKQVKLTAPTILPAQALPYLSFQNRIKTSPKGYSDLFDIAFVGPISGLSISFLALLVGLQLTTTVDPETAQLLPSLPVGFLTQSTLGGTIVDLVLGGGDGILLNQDAATQVPLHPVAVGGFVGLIIHALDLVPVGSTDGGRMSQAVLGRVWHLTLSGLVYVVMFLSSFTIDSSILLGFLFVYSITQRDMEVPCRNEVDKVELPRAVAALVSWLLAALILVPLR